MCVPPWDAGVKPIPLKPVSRPECMSTSVTSANERSTWRTASTSRHRSDENSERLEASDARERIQKLLVTGDNRLKQGVAPAKVRESYEQALEVAREAGPRGAVRPARGDYGCADLDRLSSG